MPLLLALAVSGAAEARPLQQVLNEGTLRVGVALSTPWALRGPDGELTGFEIDVAHKLAEDMEVEADIRVYEWDRLILALEAGEVDVVASGLAITPERALHVNFSEPYAIGGVSLATNVTKTANVQELDDLNTGARKIAAVEGSVATELVARLLPRAELVVFEDVQTAGSALVGGEVDGFLEEEPVPTFLALENPAAIDVPIARPLLETRTAFAVNKGDPDFVFFLNAWIAARAADTWLPTTNNYWFKSLSWRNRLEAPRRP
ncbi:transporter substrate-binding domain-containing protein [Candidatus Rariloculus sp.]|uniref:transporter substrate-binding domain-containing protein n=1 Tax=Candidatus Rariloculus sp. TaxID=3101265 RepID=UPI003D0978B5